MKGERKDIDEIWSEWRENISECIEQGIGRERKKRKMKNSEHLFSYTVEKLIKQKTILRRRLKRAEERNEDTRFYIDEIKKYRYKIQKQLREEEEKREERKNRRIKEIKEKDTAGYWKEIRKWEGKRKDREKIELEEDGVKRKDKEAASLFQSGFTKLADETSPYLLQARSQLRDLERETKYERNEQLDKPIEEEEIAKVIARMAKGKAVGEDEIALEHLTQGGDSLKSLLLLMFNCVWQREVIPHQWKATTIIPIFKTGDRKNKKNYRPISLISVVAKIFTALINTRISRHLELNHRLEEEQAGFM